MVMFWKSLWEIWNRAVPIADGVSDLTWKTRFSVRTHHPLACASPLSQRAWNSVAVRRNQKFPFQPATFGLLKLMIHEQVHRFMHIVTITRGKYLLGSILYRLTLRFCANRCRGFMIKIYKLVRNRYVAVVAYLNVSLNVLVSRKIKKISIRRTVGTGNWTRDSPSTK